MKFKVFIDGAEGTTGLKIHEYFKTRDDIEVLQIDQALRKDPDERLAKMKQADVSFLCLPDAAAAEIAAAAPADCRIIDTSTVHRVCKGWTYGFPELRITADGDQKQRDLIKESNRVANPGCHATGVIALLRPLVQNGFLQPAAFVSAVSLTGYSGGGKKMIAAYEDPQRCAAGSGASSDGTSDPRKSPGQYGLTQTHKHIPEIMQMTGLTVKPSFMPIVADFYSGMEVTVSLPGGETEGTGQLLKELYKTYYAEEPMVKVTEDDAPDGFIYANRLAGSNGLEISVRGSADNILLTATFDNLGKGASGAAVQNMNIMLGIEETKGLIE